MPRPKLLGRAKITFEALRTLMSDWGEALAVTEVRRETT